MVRRVDGIFLRVLQRLACSAAARLNSPLLLNPVAESIGVLLVVGACLWIRVLL